MKLSEIMKRSRFSRHESKMILELNLSHIQTDDDFTAVAKYFQAIVHKMPRKSTNCLIDLTGMNVSRQVESRITDIYRYCSPHFAASAVIADDRRCERMVKTVVNDLNLSRTQVFSDKEMARSYLLAG